MAICVLLGLTFFFTFLTPVDPGHLHITLLCFITLNRCVSTDLTTYLTCSHWPFTVRSPNAMILRSIVYLFITNANKMRPTADLWWIPTHVMNPSVTVTAHRFTLPAWWWAIYTRLNRANLLFIKKMNPETTIWTKLLFIWWVYFHIKRLKVKSEAENHYKILQTDSKRNKSRKSMVSDRKWCRHSNRSSYLAPGLQWRGSGFSGWPHSSPCLHFSTRLQSFSGCCSFCSGRSTGAPG